MNFFYWINRFVINHLKQWHSGWTKPPVPSSLSQFLKSVVKSSTSTDLNNNNFEMFFFFFYPLDLSIARAIRLKLFHIYISSTNWIRTTNMDFWWWQKTSSKISSRWSQNLARKTALHRWNLQNYSESHFSDRPCLYMFREPYGHPLPVSYFSCWSTRGDAEWRSQGYNKTMN